MNEQLAQLLTNYKDGVPVKIEQSSIVTLAIVEIFVVAIGALVVKFIQKL